jgi:hypothetical protein
MPAVATSFALLAGIVAVFSAPADLLPGSPRTDLAQQFLAWRAMAAASFRHGHLPLWNPAIYAGEPFLGGFQSAIFYPLNGLFLIFPLVRAVNLSLLLHGFILGAGLCRWARQRGLHPAAGVLGALLLVCGGPVFPQVYAGHLSNLCSLAWTPWILGSVEDWSIRRAPRALAIAAAATALQILAGQMQYVFYTGIAALLLGWSAPSLPPVALAKGGGRAPPFWLHSLAVLSLYLFAAALAAIQLLPGWFAAQEGLRQGNLPAAFAGQFSLPPENLLTALAGGIFGDPVQHLYWGRCYPWEMSLFLGTGSVLLLLTAATVPGYVRRNGRLLAAAGVLLLLALGQHTPLFSPLLHVPGFARFRGWSKFDFPAFVVLSLLVAEGADAVIRQPQQRRWIIGAAAALAVVLGGASAALFSHPLLIGTVMAQIHATGESYLAEAVVTAPAIVHAAGFAAAWSLLIAGAAALGFGGCLALSGLRFLRPMRWVALAVVPVEMLVFVHSQWATFRVSDAVSPELQAFFAARPGDYRVQNLVEPNNGFLLGSSDIWGNDPAVLRRYAEFIAFTQGANPDLVTQNVDFHTVSPLYPLLRLRYIVTRNHAGLHKYPVQGAMERVQVVPGYRVVTGRDAAFAVMGREGFDPGRVVVLEAEPGAGTIGSARQTFDPVGRDGSARVTQKSDDAFTVEADTPRPAILLVTDAYSRDWKAKALPGSAQLAYEIMPADHAFRATPLAPGHHLIRFEYRPRGLLAGAVISACSWIALLGWGVRGKR